MPNKNNSGLSEKLFIFFKNLASHPFLLFLLALAFAAFAAEWIFFNFNRIYLGDGAPAAPAAGGIVFGSAEENKYREVFKIMDQREKEYNAQEVPAAAPQAQN